MEPPRQETLAVDPPFLQRMDNFVVGDNLEVIAGLKAAAKSKHFAGLWIFGGGSVGKSHLLRAICGESAGKYSLFIPCSDPSSRLSSALEGACRASASKTGELIALDDVGQIAQNDELEYWLLAVYQRLVDTQGTLLVSHSGPATSLNFNLPDLNSRMRSLLHYQVYGLDDAAKAELLRQRAAHKGYTLDDAVLAYWLARGPRDINALLTDLQRLDRASLSRKRVVTIPLLKDELGY